MKKKYIFGIKIQKNIFQSDDLDEGDLGRFMDFNGGILGEYVSCNTDYNGKGVDQLKMIIEEIQKNQLVGD